MLLLVFTLSEMSLWKLVKIIRSQISQKKKKRTWDFWAAVVHYGNEKKNDFASTSGDSRGCMRLHATLCREKRKCTGNCQLLWWLTGSWAVCLCVHLLILVSFSYFQTAPWYLLKLQAFVLAVALFHFFIKLSGGIAMVFPNVCLLHKVCAAEDVKESCSAT